MANQGNPTDAMNLLLAGRAVYAGQWASQPLMTLAGGCGACMGTVGLAQGGKKKKANAKAEPKKKKADPKKK